MYFKAIFSTPHHDIHFSWHVMSTGSIYFDLLFFLFVYSTEHTEVKDLFIEAARLIKNGEIDADVQVLFVSTACIILII